MPSTTATNTFEWEDIIELISDGRCTPLISNRLGTSSLFKSDPQQAWAQDINYPLGAGDNLARIAQFVRVTEGNDDFKTKSKYLMFLKKNLFEAAEKDENFEASFLKTLKRELRGLTVTETAKRLNLFDYEDESDPLAILASLPFPVYLTTGYHTFIEEALITAGKKPRSDFYRWSETLEQQFEFADSPTDDFQPTSDEPLVYHLHGIDSNRLSLILTEENYFQFFTSINEDLKGSAGLPNAVRRALASSSLMLLGYDLYDWDFRVLFQGPIKTVFTQMRPLSVSIQLVPLPEQNEEDNEGIRKYLQDYFGNYKFQVYWGDPESFIQDLWSEWEI